MEIEKELFDSVNMYHPMKKGSGANKWSHKPKPRQQGM